MTKAIGLDLCDLRGSLRVVCVLCFLLCSSPFLWPQQPAALHGKRVITVIDDDGAPVTGAELWSIPRCARFSLASDCTRLAVAGTDGVLEWHVEHSGRGRRRCAVCHRAKARLCVA